MQPVPVFNLFVLILLSCSSGSSQQKTPAQRVGGTCEGCAAIYESPVPFEKLRWKDTLADFAEAGPRLHLFGTVYKADGKTPAPGVVLYIHHTNQQGVYPTHGNEKGWGRRHGYLRAWIRTNQQGQYSFFTLKPAAYPGRTDPAHVHLTIKEPDLNEYYVDDVMFEGDAHLTPAYRSRLEKIGGNGIIRLAPGKGMLEGRRDIILGKNVRDYPHRN
jgi:protocatechuate 3,4-dioxygenase, beta subunit